MSIKSNAAVANDISIDIKDPEIVQEYKHLNDKCDAVLDKINKRKKNVNKKIKK
jgi:hypothetical protein